MEVQHLQSATQIIKLGDIKILSDPWLTDGEYYGSWYHYPPFPDAKIDKLEYDFIYVSHIHPDHLSEETFRRLPLNKPVLIHNYDSKFLKRKLEMLGFEVIENDHGQPFVFENGGSITIYAADNCNPQLCAKFLGCGIVEKNFGSTQIDSLAVFEYDGESILNANDCPFELAKFTIKENSLDKKNIDLLLVGYGGAGPYPQCFEFDTLEQKADAANAKEKQSLEQAVKYIELIKPKAYAPFAGTYILGSRLSKLTDFRGVASLTTAIDYLKKRIECTSEGVLLEQLDTYDLNEKKLVKALAPREFSYDEYILKISQNDLSFDADEWDDNELEDLMYAACERFNTKAEEINFMSDTNIVVGSDQFAFRFSIGEKPIVIDSPASVEEPFIKLIVDHKLLHRLLRGPRYAHWNNAEIGSHIHYERRPNSFERGLNHCVCFLHQ